MYNSVSNKHFTDRKKIKCPKCKSKKYWTEVFNTFNHYGIAVICADCYAHIGFLEEK